MREMRPVKVFLTGPRQSGKTAFLRRVLQKELPIEPHFAYFKHRDVLFQVFDVWDASAKAPPDYTFVLFNLHQQSLLPAVLKTAASSANPVLVGNFWRDKQREIRQFELLTTPYTYWEVDVGSDRQIQQLFMYLIDSSIELFTEQRAFQLENEVEIENELNKAYTGMQQQIALAKADLLGYVKQQDYLLKEVEKLNQLAGIEWSKQGDVDTDRLHAQLSLLDIYFSGYVQELEKQADAILQQQEEDIAAMQRDYDGVLGLLRQPGRPEQR